MAIISKVKDFTSRDKEELKTRDLIRGYRNEGLSNIIALIYNKAELEDREKIKNKIDDWLKKHSVEKDIPDEKRLESGGQVSGFTREEAALVAFLYLGEEGEEKVEYLQGRGTTSFDYEGEVKRLENLKILFDVVLSIAKKYDLSTLSFNHRPSAMARILNDFFSDPEIQEIVEKENKHSDRGLLSEMNEEEYRGVYNEIEEVVKSRIGQKIEEYQDIHREINKAIQNRNKLRD